LPSIAGAIISDLVHMAISKLSNAFPSSGVDSYCIWSQSLIGKGTVAASGALLMAILNDYAMRSLVASYFFGSYTSSSLMWQQQWFGSKYSCNPNWWVLSN